jgi:hypothetical protein
MSRDAAHPRKTPEPRARPLGRVVAVTAVIVAAVAAGIWAVVHFTGDDSAPAVAPTSAAATTRTTTAAPTASSAKATSPAALAALAKKLGHPIYWAGRKTGFTYELTRTSKGGVYVRYLPAGVKPGVRKPYLTVATYPAANGYAKLQVLAGGPGWSRLVAQRKAVAFYNASAPTSVYMAFPGTNVQVEIYDPSAKRAQALAESTSIVPVAQPG